MAPEPPVESLLGSSDAPPAARGERSAAQDVLAQTFAAILVQLRAAAELSERDPSAAAVFRRQAEHLAEAGLAEARRGDAPDGGDAALARALGRLARWADSQRLCACSFVDARRGGQASPAVSAAAFLVARALVVDAVECRALRRIDVFLERDDTMLRLSLDGELVTDAPPGWLDRVRLQVDDRVRAADGTLALTVRRDPPCVRVVAEFRTG